MVGRCRRCAPQGMPLCLATASSKASSVNGERSSSDVEMSLMGMPSSHTCTSSTESSTVAPQAPRNLRGGNPPSAS